MDTCFLYNTTMAFVTSREHVQQLAEMVLSELPEEFREYFTIISIIIEAIPSCEECNKAGIKRNNILGLFQGTEYQQKGSFFDIPLALPYETIFLKRRSRPSALRKMSPAKRCGLPLFMRQAITSDFQRKI